MSTGKKKQTAEPAPTHYKYTVESDEGGDTEAVATKDTVQLNWQTNGYFSHLRDEDDDFVFSWCNAHGKGEMRIPAHIFYDLPTMTIILDDMKKRAGFTGLCSPIRVHRNQPIATLFQPETR